MIISELANIVNNFVINLYNNGIHFYQILIGLFIFNYLIYVIVNIVRRWNNR